MMATAAVVGISAGKRLLSFSSYSSTSSSSSTYYTSTTSTTNTTSEQHLLPASSTKNLITLSKKTSNYASSFQYCTNTSESPSLIRPLKEHPADGDGSSPPTISLTSAPPSIPPLQEEDPHFSSVEALLLLQKSMLENQLKLSFEHIGFTHKSTDDTHVTSSGLPARLRRRRRRRTQTNNFSIQQSDKDKLSPPTVSPDLLQNHFIGYVRGVTSDELLTHAQVVNLSQKIRIGLSLDEHRSRLKESLGCEPSDEQLAMSLRMTCAELRSKLIECTLAREKLAMSNVRLVMSIAQRYENMGADMADLIQGGLIGLLRGIEKFDSSKGFKISTYVYWWIRQGVSRTLVENSRTLRLPTHLHERLSLIRNAKNRLEEKGITPSIDRIAECLNMSHKKIKNATEAVRSVLSLDREVFPSLNGLPGETFHSYIADNHLENNPWHVVDEWALKRDVKNLINTTLREREKDIIHLYYGLDDECLTWEEISKRIGLSRERVRQVGLVALEKLKHAARKGRMEALLIKH